MYVYLGAHLASEASAFTTVMSNNSEDQQDVEAIIVSDPNLCQSFFVSP